MASKIETLRIQSRNDFYRSICNSWTWARLTHAEQVRFLECMEGLPLLGTKAIMIEALNTLYRAFLYGTGYSWDGWREESKGA